MKQYHFIKINPAGNMTILYDFNSLDNEPMQHIAKTAMNEFNLFGEQVGFIKNSHLQMMGGEFCGNASRAFASYLAFKDPTFEDTKTYTITCSGESSHLQVYVRQMEDKHLFLAKIRMPAYISMDKILLQDINGNNYTIYKVLFTGICHFIYEGPVDEKVILCIDKYCQETTYTAYGIMFLETSTLSIKPYVKVKGFNGIWENSCASGTTAVGYYLNIYKLISSAKILQPGGWLQVTVEKDGIYIDGPVEIVAEGSSYMSLP